MNNEYLIHTAMKCSDGKVYRLSYDLTEQTEGSIKEFGRVFAEMERMFPNIAFWATHNTDEGVEYVFNSKYITEDTFSWNTDNEV